MSRLLKLTLVRHRKTELNQPGIYYGHTDLSMEEEGVQQIRALARRLSGEPEAVYSSDLSRCIETSRLLWPDQHPIAMPALREISFGKWEGMHYTQAQRLFPEGWQRFCAGGAPEGGEDASTFYNRVTGGLQEILGRHESGQIAIVSHQGCIRAMLAHLLGMGSEQVWRFKIPPAGMATVEIVDGYAVLTQMG